MKNRLGDTVQIRTRRPYKIGGLRIIGWDRHGPRFESATIITEAILDTPEKVERWNAGDESFIAADRSLSSLP